MKNMSIFQLRKSINLGFIHTWAFMFLFLMMVPNVYAGSVKPPIWQETPTASGHVKWVKVYNLGRCATGATTIDCGEVWRHGKSVDYIDKRSPCRAPAHEVQSCHSLPKSGITERQLRKRYSRTKR